MYLNYVCTMGICPLSVRMSISLNDRCDNNCYWNHIYETITIFLQSGFFQKSSWKILQRHKFTMVKRTDDVQTNIDVPKNCIFIDIFLIFAKLFQFFENICDKKNYIQFLIK